MSAADNGVVILRVGLFPDPETIESAMEVLAEGHDVCRHDLTDPAMSEQGWDRVVDDILATRKVVTI